MRAHYKTTERRKKWSERWLWQQLTLVTPKHVFVDDMKILKCTASVSEFNNLKQELDSLCNWSSKGTLPFNESKILALRFSPSSQVKSHFNYAMNNTPHLKYPESDTKVRYRYALLITRFRCSHHNRSNEMIPKREHKEEQQASSRIA